MDSNQLTERDLSFDRNGNILTLKRYGTNVAVPQDNLAYTYEGNKLMQLNNATYQYDTNGNMTHDGRRGLDLSWNHLNLPATISTEEDEDATVNYTYLADGIKVLAQAPGTGEGYAYLGTMVYKLNNGTWSLETTPFTGGRFVRNAAGNFVEQRHITDHLGSTRTIVEGDDYTEVEQNDYYPFGKRIADNSLQTTPTNRWRFSGKEIQTLGEINLIDFGARLYDEDAVKWKGQDPMAESYLNMTPYGYCSGDPINRFDANGSADFWFKGRVIGNDGVKDNKVRVIKNISLKRREIRTTKAFIKRNSSNQEAFNSDPIAYANSVEIEGSPENRQKMVTEVSRDDGSGGTDPNNNREYGGVLLDGEVILCPPGLVTDPSANASATITLPSQGSSFHSHPSGIITDATTTYFFVQEPSDSDKATAGSVIHYVFGRRDNTVYIYDSSGTLATIPDKHFVSPKKTNNRIEKQQK